MTCHDWELSPQYMTSLGVSSLSQRQAYGAFQHRGQEAQSSKLLYVLSFSFSLISYLAHYLERHSAHRYTRPRPSTVRRYKPLKRLATPISATPRSRRSASWLRTQSRFTSFFPSSTLEILHLPPREITQRLSPTALNIKHHIQYRNPHPLRRRKIRHISTQHNYADTHYNSIQKTHTHTAIMTPIASDTRATMAPLQSIPGATPVEESVSVWRWLVGFLLVGLAWGGTTPFMRSK